MEDTLTSNILYTFCEIVNESSAKVGKPRNCKDTGIGEERVLNVRKISEKCKGLDSNETSIALIMK